MRVKDRGRQKKEFVMKRGEGEDQIKKGNRDEQRDEQKELGKEE